MTPLIQAAMLIGAGGICLSFAIKVLIQKRRILEVVPSSDFTVQLPTKWDDAEITGLLHRHQNQPAVLSHVVASIKTRMVLNQDLKTARQRLQLLGSVIEVFRLNRELQGVLHDIHIADKEFEIKQVESDIRKEDADARLKSERQLRDLRKQRDELQLKKEITVLQQDIKSVEKPAGQEQKLSPEQERTNRHMQSEARLTKLKEEKQRALKIDDEQERLLKVNAIDDEIQREMVEWSKTLP
jgi:hypothetical protein